MATFKTPWLNEPLPQMTKELQLLARLEAFVNQPGFFRVEKGSRQVAPGKAVTNWMVSANPWKGQPDDLATVIWGSGPTLDEALDRWEDTAKTFAERNIP